MFKFELGEKVRDPINGFEGKITIRAECLGTNNRYFIETQTWDPRGAWIYEGRLERVAEEEKPDE